MPDDRPTTWPEYEYQIHLGAYGGLDDRVKRRTRKQPIGFAPPTTHHPKPKPRRKTR